MFDARDVAKIAHFSLPGSGLKLVGVADDRRMQRRSTSRLFVL